jgi:hypothetical protein
MQDSIYFENGLHYQVTLDDLSRRWFRALDLGDILLSVELTKDIVYHFETVGIDRVLWPTCYLPSNIDDAHILQHASKRQTALRLIFERKCSSKRGISGAGSSPLEGASIVCLSQSYTTHINAYSLARTLKSRFKRRPYMIRIKPNRLGISQDDLRGDETLDKVYMRYYSNFAETNTGNRLLSNTPYSYHIIDATHGTTESLEGVHIGNSVEHMYGFHIHPSKAESDYVRELKSYDIQDWQITNWARDSLQTCLGRYYVQKKRIVFPCALYKYSSYFWLKLVQMTKDPDVMYIGITISKKVARQVISSLQYLGADCSKIYILHGCSHREIVNKILLDFDIGYDMYLNGGSILTPLLLRSGFPVIHEATQSYFSKRQCANYELNKISFLIKDERGSLR